VGFWEWLSGGPQRVQVTDDVIWMTRAAKLRGLAQAVHDRLGQGHPVLVVAHFPATLAEVREALGGPGGVSLDDPKQLSADDALRHAEAGSGRRPPLALAQALVADDYPNPVDEAAGSLAVLVAERHFLRASDDRVVAFARSLGRRSDVTFHLSLDDPLLRAVTGTWVANVLSSLGLKESEPIESRLVARRIAAAQRRFARRAVEGGQAESAEEWLRRNDPDA
jgi:preprotein translocase subunit SecA